MHKYLFLKDFLNFIRAHRYGHARGCFAVERR